MEQVNREVAEKDFYKWLDNFGYTPDDFEQDGYLEDLKRVKNKIISEMVSGKIEVTEDNEILQILHLPITDDDGNVKLSELKYKKEYRAYEQNRELRGLDFDKDGAQVPLRMAKLLTGHGTAILGKMWSRDLKNLQAIMSFFLN